MIARALVFRKPGHCANARTKIPRRLAVLLVFLGLVLAPAFSQATTIDFEGLANFVSPGPSIAGIIVSPEGGIADEATVALITGFAFSPGTVSTSGTSLLANLYGSTLSITFDTPATNVSLQTVGSLSGSVFGTVILEAFAGSTLIGSVSSDPAVLGDSGAPEALLDLGSLAGITSISLHSDIGGASTFLIDDLAYSAVPEPSTAVLLLTGLLLLSTRRSQ